MNVTAKPTALELFVKIIVSMYWQLYIVGYIVGLLTCRRGDIQ